MMTDTAPQIEAVSEATSIPQTTDFHLGEIEPPPPACFLQEEDEEEGIWIWGCYLVVVVVVAVP